MLRHRPLTASLGPGSAWQAMGGTQHPAMLPDHLDRFALPGHLAIDTPPHGLTRLTVCNTHAKAELHLLGAHVTRFQPHGGQPVLWMSAQSQFQAGRPLRGGVPICWPWFGPHPGDSTQPIHGFVRTRDWELAETVALPDGGTRITLVLRDDEHTRRVWPHAFVLRYTITIGATLELALRVENPGAAPFTCSEALHTYLAVGDVRRIAVGGLAGTTYVDKLRQSQRFGETGDVVITGETDRVYLGTAATCTVHDPLLGRRLVIAKDGSQTTVVWNPWIDKAKAMADFADDEWPGMLCVETVNALDHALTIAPGGSHVMTARISSTALTP